MHRGPPTVDEDDRVEAGDEVMIEKMIAASGTAGWWVTAYCGMQWSKPACTASALVFGILLYLMFEYAKTDGSDL